MLSAFITTPLVNRAASNAAADLPLAVGPAMMRTGLAGAAPEGSELNAILTLVAPLGDRLDPQFLDMGQAVLAAGGAGAISAPDLFAEGRAADIAAEADFRDERLAAAVRATFGPAALDFALQPSETRLKRLLIADMDSTVVTTETLDEMAGEAGLKDQISAITARAMNGELDFESALRERMALLAGMDAGVLERTYAGTELSPGAEAMVAGMRKAGAECRLVSGGFKYFTSRVAERLDFNGDQANDIEVLDGKITGRVLDPILDKHAKLATLRALASELSISLDDAVTVGDGANDLPMLEAAGLGIAWRAKPSVAARARARIDYGDLTTLLLFQRLDAR